MDNELEIHDHDDSHEEVVEEIHEEIHEEVHEHGEMVRHKGNWVRRV